MLDSSPSLVALSLPLSSFCPWRKALLFQERFFHWTPGSVHAWSASESLERLPRMIVHGGNLDLNSWVWVGVLLIGRSPLGRCPPQRYDGLVQKPQPLSLHLFVSAFFIKIPEWPLSLWVQVMLGRSRCGFLCTAAFGAMWLFLFRLLSSKLFILQGSGRVQVRTPETIDSAAVVMSDAGTPSSRQQGLRQHSRRRLRSPRPQFPWRDACATKEAVCAATAGIAAPRGFSEGQRPGWR